MRFRITPRVFAKLAQFRQFSKRNETGGILLGKVLLEEVIVDAISLPNEQDSAGRTYFRRNVKVAQSVVNKVWEESQGERIYLGEWHTHPENCPSPSGDDLCLLDSMLKHSKMHIDFLFMVIVGLQDCCIIYNDKVNRDIYRGAIPFGAIAESTDSNAITLLNFSKGFSV